MTTHKATELKINHIEEKFYYFYCKMWEYEWSYQPIFPWNIYKSQLFTSEVACDEAISKEKIIHAHDNIKTKITFKKFCITLPI